MHKIPTLFLRDPEKPWIVTDQVNPDCAWVLAGEGQAYVKWDGTAIRVLDGELWKRYTLRPNNTPPPSFECKTEIGPGKFVGWVRAPEDDPANQWLYEAIGNYPGGYPLDGTYELCGPKVPPSSPPGDRKPRPGVKRVVHKADPHGFGRHVLVPHSHVAVSVGSTYEALKAFFSGGGSWEARIQAGFPVDLAGPRGAEGLVWHHPDGRMAKVKRTDFGLPWAQ